MSTAAFDTFTVRRPGGTALTAATGVLVVGGVSALLATRSPVVALLGLAAAVVVIASTFRPELALLILVATGPLEGQFGSSTSTLSVTKVAGLLAFGSFVANAVATRRRIHAGSTHLVVLLLLCIALLSTVHAHDASIATSTALRYASFVLLFWVVSQAVDDERLQRRIAWTLVIASAIAAAIALDNFLAGHTAVATLKGTQEDDMGFILATSVPMALWLLGSRTALRPVVVVILGLIGTALVFSFARGGMLALAVGAVWQIVVERRHVRLLLVGAVAASLAALFVVHSNSSAVNNGLFLKRAVASQNVSIRLEVWDAAARLASDHPLLGIGPGNFRDVFYSSTGRPVGSQPQLAVAHNAYLDIAAELGVIAFLLFVAYLGLTFARLAGCVRENVGPPGFASIVRTSLVVTCVGSLTLSGQYFPQFWLFGGIAAALWAEYRIRPVAAVAAAPVPVPRPTYDPAVSDRRSEERDRRVRDQLSAARAQQERLKRMSDDLRLREERLARERAEIDRGERVRREEATRLAALGAELDARERRARALEEHARALAAEVEARSKESEHRRADIRLREEKLADWAARLQDTEADLWQRGRRLEQFRESLEADRRAYESARASLAARERELGARDASLARFRARLDARAAALAKLEHDLAQEMQQRPPSEQ